MYELVLNSKFSTIYSIWVPLLVLNFVCLRRRTSSIHISRYLQIRPYPWSRGWCRGVHGRILIITTHGYNGVLNLVVLVRYLEA